MTYISLDFLLFVSIILLLYYLPCAFLNGASKAVIQQIVLLLASFLFYYLAVEIDGLILFCFTVVISYLFARFIPRASGRWKKCLLALGIVLSGAPLLIVKIIPWFKSVSALTAASLIVPLGLSFYTLQIVAYLVDCCRGTVVPEKNLLRYALFISFFPQIVQGPIPRYSQLAPQLRAPHDFTPEDFTHGFQLILWGCFLKFMIAEKAAVPVNLVFGNFTQYAGFHVLTAAALYSIQLYTDFYSCVCICRGVALLFGIRLADNFHRPYFALTIKDFWKRWHITLSTWLRDYIYIPLGGSRRGTARTYANIIIVFLVSGLWHGNSLSFLVWGLLHAAYQIAGAVTKNLRSRAYAALRVDQKTFSVRLFQRAVVFVLTTFSWVFFRAGRLRDALAMLKNIFVDFNPWVILGGSRFSLGLDVHDVVILMLSIAVLVLVSACQERGFPIRKAFCRQNTAFRWLVYLLAIAAIWVFGAYGSGFNAADFIYGGF